MRLSFTQERGSDEAEGFIEALRIVRNGDSSLDDTRVPEQFHQSIRKPLTFIKDGMY